MSPKLMRFSFGMSTLHKKNEVFHLLADLVTFTGEIFNGKLHFLYSGSSMKYLKYHMKNSSDLVDLIQQLLDNELEKNDFDPIWLIS